MAGTRGPTALTPIGARRMPTPSRPSGARSRRAARDPRTSRACSTSATPSSARRVAARTGAGAAVGPAESSRSPRWASSSRSSSWSAAATTTPTRTTSRCRTGSSADRTTSTAQPRSGRALQRARDRLGLARRAAAGDRRGRRRGHRASTASAPTSSRSSTSTRTPARSASCRSPATRMVTLLANQNLYGRFNRLNVNYASGPALLIRTIEANFGIPINHVIQVGFGGSRARSTRSAGCGCTSRTRRSTTTRRCTSPHTGCLKLDGYQALAVARSRHFEYFTNHVWNVRPDERLRAHRPPEPVPARAHQRGEGPVQPRDAQRLPERDPQGRPDRQRVRVQRADRARDQVPLVQPRDAQRLHAADLQRVQPERRRRPVRQPARRPAAARQRLRPGGHRRRADAGREPAAELGRSRPPSPRSSPTPKPPRRHHHDDHEPEHHDEPPKPHPTTTTTQPLHTEPWYTYNPVACTPR